MRNTYFSLINYALSVIWSWQFFGPLQVRGVRCDTDLMRPYWIFVAMFSVSCKIIKYDVKTLKIATIVYCGSHMVAIQHVAQPRRCPQKYKLH